MPYIMCHVGVCRNCNCNCFIDGVAKNCVLFSFSLLSSHIFEFKNSTLLVPHKKKDERESRCPRRSRGQRARRRGTTIAKYVNRRFSVLMRSILAASTPASVPVKCASVPVFWRRLRRRRNCRSLWRRDCGGTPR